MLPLVAVFADFSSAVWPKWPDFEVALPYLPLIARGRTPCIPMRWARPGAAGSWMADKVEGAHASAPG